MDLFFASCHPHPCTGGAAYLKIMKNDEKIDFLQIVVEYLGCIPTCLKSLLKSFYALGPILKLLVQIGGFRY